MNLLTSHLASTCTKQPREVFCLFIFYWHIIDAFELWCWRRLLESPLDCKEIQPVHPKGDQSWVFIGGTDPEAETPILRPPHAKSWLIGKKPLMLGGIGGRRRRGRQRMRWLDGITDSMDEFEWTLGVGGQGGLARCDSWGRKESDTTERLNWTELNWWVLLFYFFINALKKETCGQKDG